VSNSSDVQYEGEGRKIGQVIDSLGVLLDVAETDLVTDVVVITKIVNDDGGVRLGFTWSTGMSWLERLGMLHAAVAIDSPGYEAET
jgi:hypothetical protein